MPTAEYTKAAGSTIFDPETGLRDTKIRTHIQGSSSTVKLTEWVFTTGKMESHTMESGSEVLKKAKESGKATTAARMSGNGSSQRQKASEFTSGPLETSTKASGKTVSNMGKGQNPLQMAMCSPAGMRTVDRMARGLTNGQTERITLVILWMG